MPHLDRLREEMKIRGLRAVLVSDPVHERYLTSLALEDALILVSDTTAYLLTDFRYREAAQATCSKEFSVETPTGSRLAFLSEILKNQGIDRLAVEEDSMTLSAFDRIGEKLTGVELVGGASAMLGKLRLQKTKEELDVIKRAQKITDRAFSHVLKMMTPNMTEAEVALELEFFMRRAGAEGVAFETIAVSGSASSRPHGVPRNVPLEKGFLTMDFGAKLDGYCSDMTRTVVVGRADGEMKRLYETVLNAQKSAISAIREGVSCREIDGVARKLIEGNGYEKCFGHALGHGVGIEIHEEPRLSPAVPEDLRLQVGNVVTVEPGIYLAGKYGCRIEDMGAILPDGSFWDMTQSEKELIELF